MAAYFQLYKIGEETPTTFQQVDKEMCEFFNAPVDEKYWFCGWYDTVGFKIAVTAPSSWQVLREEYAKQKLEFLLETQHPEQAEWYNAILDIIDWFEPRYTFSAWQGR